MLQTATRHIASVAALRYLRRLATPLTMLTTLFERCFNELVSILKTLFALRDEHPLLLDEHPHGHTHKHTNGHTHTHTYSIAALCFSLEIGNWEWVFVGALRHLLPASLFAFHNGQNKQKISLAHTNTRTHTEREWERGLWQRPHLFSMGLKRNV